MQATTCKFDSPLPLTLPLTATCAQEAEAAAAQHAAELMKTLDESTKFSKYEQGSEGDDFKEVGGVRRCGC